MIVESPAKARTIERYLGPDYRVLASYGHVRDLPENPGKNKLGVDVDHDFEPEYVVSEDRKKQVATITREAKVADAVYLATDLDLEGESTRGTSPRRPTSSRARRAASPSPR